MLVMRILVPRLILGFHPFYCLFFCVVVAFSSSLHAGVASFTCVSVAMLRVPQVHSHSDLVYTMLKLLTRPAAFCIVRNEK